MPRRKKDTRGRKPVSQSVRANWRGPNGRVVRFALSADIVEKLRMMHMAAFSMMYGPAALLAGHNPLRRPRVEVRRLDDFGLPAVLLRIEPPSYDPKGVRLARDPRGQRWFVEVPARAIGVHPNMLPHEIEFVFDEKNPRLLGGGIILMLPADVMLPPREKKKAA